MSNRPRQIDIAHAAGVSQTTVSLVLNDRRGADTRIPEDTRQRVLSAIKRAGYVANPVARSLSGARSELVGLFTFEAIAPGSDHFYGEFIEGIVEGCEAEGRDLLVFTSTSRDATSNHIFRENGNRLRLADGAIMLGNGDPRIELERLVAEHYPFVFIGRREISTGELSWVSPDYVDATRRLIERLVALGHTDIAYLGVDLGAHASHDRRIAYSRALRDAGLEVPRPLAVRSGDYSAVPALLRRGTTALVVEPLVDVAELARAVERGGWSIPSDVSIAVMGDVHGEAVRAWSGYRLPRRALGRASVHALTRLIESPGDGPIQEEFECQQVEGETMGAARP